MALEAKAAAALLKYVPLPADLLPAAIAHLSTGAAADLWAARAAALVFAQVPLWVEGLVMVHIYLNPALVFAQMPLMWRQSALSPAVVYLSACAASRL